MANGTQIIWKPITIPADIAMVLGIKAYDVKTICQSGAIKKWAKYKPVDINQKERITEAQRQSSTVNYGITNIPTWSNINKMANFWFACVSSDNMYANRPDCGIQTDYWAYKRPTTYNRLTDFLSYDGTIGYYHGAEAPIGGSIQSKYNIESGGTLTLVFKAGAQDSRTIKLSDLTYPGGNISMSGMYFGVMMRNISTGVIYAGTSNILMSEIDTYGANIAITGLSSSFQGSYEVFPMASSYQISFTSSLGSYTNGKFIALYPKETIGIGVTVTVMNITPESFNLYRDTSVSTRYLNGSIRLQNDVYPGTLGASVYFEVFNESGTVIATNTISTTWNIAAGGDYLMSVQIDMSSLANLRAAFSARATVTPNAGTNIMTTSATCTVTDGRSPYA